MARLPSTSPTDLPVLPSAFNGLLLRPIWREARVVSELRELRSSAIATGGGLPPGDGQPVVLVPGYMAGSGTFDHMAVWLRAGGYEVSIADVGRNARSSSWAADRIAAAVRVAADRSKGGNVVLIGHSRGGQQCRVVASRDPAAIKKLITLGSPVRHHVPRYLPLRSTIHLTRLIARTPIGPPVDADADRAYERELFAPFPTEAFATDPAWIAIYSRVDGVVEWQSCVATGARAVEVASSHSGLTASVAAFEAIADALDY